MSFRPHLSAAAIALALVGPIALGAAHEAEARGADRPAPRAMLDFSAVDTDGDGVISEAEWNAFRSGETGAEARAARMIAAYDTDGDGLLSAEELAAARQGMPRRGVPDEARAAAMAERMFEMLDTDSDGMLSPEEFAAGIARMQERLAERGPRMRERGHEAPRRGSGWR